jgi:hypothetical protein
MFEKIMPHFVLQCFTEKVEDFGPKVILKKKTYKNQASIKSPKITTPKVLHYNPSQKISSTYCQYLIRMN